MTLPLFLLEPGRLDGAEPGTRVLLDGAEGHHAATVRRIGRGEEVLLADGRGRCALSRVADAGRDQLHLEVLQVTEDAAPQPRFVLVQALAKGDRDDQAIEAATELGVDEVVPWQASRSVVQWRGERGQKARRKWQAALVAATKQSRRSRIPVLAPVVDSRALADRVQGAALTLVLHEEASLRLTETTLPAEGDVLVVVGPEGGITPDEIQALQAAGADAVRLGETVLRSSSAGPAALAVLSAHHRWR